MKTTEVKLAEGWKIAGKPTKQVVVGLFYCGGYDGCGGAAQ